MSATSAKTDNDNLPAKLALRRSFLAEHVALGGSLDVVDCFSGSEMVWQPLRRQFPVERYFAIDRKKKIGRVQGDSLEILRACGPAFTVIDLDAYGSPWEHWLQIVEDLPKSSAARGAIVTVFLTVGNVGLKQQAARAIEAMGLAFKLPPSLHCLLSARVPEFLLRAAPPPGWRLDRLAEGAPGRSARYFGVRFTAKDDFLKKA